MGGRERVELDLSRCPANAVAHRDTTVLAVVYLHSSRLSSQGFYMEDLLRKGSEHGGRQSNEEEKSRGNDCAHLDFLVSTRPTDPLATGASLTRTTSGRR